MLQGIGVDCYRVELPRGMDVNEYARKMTPARKALELVLHAARWMGPEPPPARRMSLPPVMPQRPPAPPAAEARA